MGRWPVVVALVAVCASIASFIVQLETTSARWELYAINRGSAVLVGFALIGALVFERRPSVTALWAQAAAAAMSIAFVTVALAKLYERTSFGVSIENALNWAGEASFVALAALAFGLFGLRRRSAVVTGGLASAIGMALGCAGYAISLKGAVSAYVWWSLATTGTFLAACAAARIERR